MREPDITLRIWFDAEGLRGEVNHVHTGYGFDHPYLRVYDKQGQLAAIGESFRQELLEFVDDFQKKRR